MPRQFRGSMKPPRDNRISEKPCILSEYRAFYALATAVGAQYFCLGSPCKKYAGDGCQDSAGVIHLFANST